jgi:hypothetical protein
MSPNNPLDISSDNRVLKKFDISNNPTIVNEYDDGSGEEYSDGITSLVNAFKSNATITELNVAGLVGKHSNAGPGVAALIADAIPDMGAMTALDISANSIVADEYIKAPRKGIKIGELVDGNPVIEEEDDDGEIMILQLNGIRAIASAIPNMGALSMFTFSGDRDDSKPVTMKTSMVEMDFGGKGLGASGAIMVAAYLPKCT